MWTPTPSRYGRWGPQSCFHLYTSSALSDRRVPQSYKLLHFPSYPLSYSQSHQLALASLELEGSGWCLPASKPIVIPAMVFACKNWLQQLALKSVVVHKSNYNDTVGLMLEGRQFRQSSNACSRTLFPSIHFGANACSLILHEQMSL